MVIPSYTKEGYAENAVNADNATVAEIAFIADSATKSETANTANYALTAETAISVKYYSETLLSGLTEDDVPVSFYILTKN